MRLLKVALMSLAATISVTAFLFFASQWWEKAFATVAKTELSPGGCYRLVQYAPHWVIPASFHPARDPQENWTPLDNWYAPWMPNEAPAFFRLYNSRTGQKLGESAVYDLTMIGPGGVHWPQEYSRRMSVGFVYLADDLPPCRGAIPDEVEAFVSDRNVCDHLRGEIPDPGIRGNDSPKIDEINRACDGTDKRLETLRAKYANDAGVVEALSTYEWPIQAGGN
ncbi:hypothetical protein ABIE51_002609 [Lysobacter sp. OAE881]|uniref:hypothetical protein n=1 Tax=Lysobacter sp. OAE881 TaxID=2663813 RepID=UPI00178A02BF